MDSPAQELQTRLAALEAECAALREEGRAAKAAADQAARRLSFLAEASALLARSLDYETTLATVARLAIPFLGDSCVLHVIDEDGAIRYVEQAHVLPEKEELVRRLRSRHPLTWETNHPLVEVLRSGHAFRTTDATALIRGHVADDAAALEMIQALRYNSLLIIPLVVRGEVRGALSLIVSESDRRYDAEDVIFAEELARRAAQAIENARLYGEAQAAIRHKDELLDELRRLQEQLLQAQRLESIGRLAAGVAHDFNNLLTVIGGYAELVAGDAAAGAEASGLSEIQRAVDRAATLTRRLLAFARRQPFAPRPVDLAVLLADIERLIRRLIGEEIALSVSCEPAIWPISADPSQIEQILINLAVNARDAMPGGGAIEIVAANLRLGQPYLDAHVHVPIAEYVTISLRDEGNGIAPADQGRVFEPFFTTKELGKGTGLGLAMCYGIVQQHRGYITFTSAPGAGTTFRIFLPRAAGAVAEPSGPAAQPGAVGGAETVLVVEDEPAVRDLVARVLRARGYNVLVAGDGAAALALVDGNSGPPIALVLSDVRMPQMGGPELARHLAERHPKIKVLFMSGYTDSQLSERELVESGWELIGKPFAAEHLARTVRRIIERGP